MTLLGDAAHPVTWTGGGNDAIADGLALTQLLSERGLTPEALRAHEAAMLERNPASKAATSRRGLPSYRPLTRVLWWWSWSALRPLAFVLCRASPFQSMRALAFGAYELLR